MLANIYSLLSTASIIVTVLFWLFSAKNLGDDNKNKVDRVEKELITIREKTETLNERLSRIEGKIDFLIKK